MGKAMSLITKPLRTFNVESRAFKEISKEKPTPAPRHKSDEYDVEKLMKGLCALLTCDCAIIVVINNF